MCLNEIVWATTELGEVTELGGAQALHGPVEEVKLSNNLQKNSCVGGSKIRIF